jgi:hypothetical protein
VNNRLPGALVVPCVFAALVVATFAAFFITTRLKRSPPVVEQLSFRRHFSPNADGRLDVEPISFKLRRSDDVTVSIVSADGDTVATLADDVSLTKGRHRFRWDGRAAGDGAVADGEYRVRVRLRHQGRTVTSPRKLFIDTTAPNPVVKYVSPGAIYPGAAGADRARVRFVGPTRIAPTLLVYNTDGAQPRLVARRLGRKGSPMLGWDGRVGLGASTRPAPAGNYLMAVRTRDAAGNDGPAQLPPTRATVRGHPGLVVRYLAAAPPKGPVSAGAAAKFGLLTGGRRYRWSLRRLGSSRELRRGSARSSSLSVHVPATQRSGVEQLSIQVGAHRYSSPFAVQGSEHQKVLVVLPSTTWMALDPLDSNGDGFADRLPLDRVVPAARPISGSGLPAGFQSDIAPALAFLDAHGLRYDLTTDLAIGDGDLDRYDGVLFVAAPRVAPVGLTRRLRSAVSAGKSLAWIGPGGFTLAARPVEASLARAPSPPGRNAFGERLNADPVGGLLGVKSDRSHLFNGVPDAFGPFARFELQVAAPPQGSVRSAAAPRDEGAAIVAIGYGEGIIVRIGVGGFGRSLAPGSGLDSSARIMRNLWKLLRS